MKEQWIEDLRQRLADYEQPAPTLDWDIIEQTVAAQRKPRRTRLTTLWPRLAAAAAVAALLVGTATLYLSDHTKEVAQDTGGTTRRATTGKGEVNGQLDNMPQTDGGNTAHAPQPNGSSLTERLFAAVNHLAERTIGGAMTHTGSPADAPLLAFAQPSTETATAFAPETVTEPATTTATESGTPQRDKAVTTRTLPTPTRHATTTMPYEPRHAATPHSLGTLTAKAYVSGALGSASNTSAMGVLMSDAPFSQTEQDHPANFEPTTGTASVPDRRVKHHQPVRLGLSVRYRLNDRWSVEGGVTYSHHTSDITETAGDHTRQSAQQLDFVGIPVTASYSIWSNRHVNIYASAGAEVERMVHGKRTVQTTIGGTTAPEETERVKMTRPVFSVNAAVGAELKLGQTVSLYAEPGVGYHFDNGSSLSTIYTDKPLNASLNVGVRFSVK